MGPSQLRQISDSTSSVVFVHGLQGHPRKTWACERDSEKQNSSVSYKEHSHGLKRVLSRIRNTSRKNAKKSDEVLWPLHFLSEDCTSIRILTWGYDSKVSNFFHGAANQSNISAYTRNLLAALKNIRSSCQRRKLIFIAHSLGGIIVKDLLHRAAVDADPLICSLYSSTEAILFLGTPHRGSAKAGLAEVVKKIVSASGLDTYGQNIHALQVNSFELETIHEQFMRLYEKQDRHFKVLTFQEAKGMVGISYLKLNERVVEPYSSSLTSTEPTQTINSNHMDMCRFPTRETEGYNQILGEINAMISDIRRRETRKDKELSTELSIEASSQSTTTGSPTCSLNDTERKCIAILAENTSNIAEYRSSLPKRVEGTCRWILLDPHYREWYLTTESCLLWINGDPGSGKTILSAYLLEYLETAEFSPRFRTRLCYFFCDEKIEKQRDSKTILRSLIHQLITGHRPLVKYVKTAYELYGSYFHQNLTELWKILLAIASDKQVGPVTVLVDAIDECERITRERFLQDIVKLIEKSKPKNKRLPCIKFLFTSRPPTGRQYTAKLVQIDPLKNHVDQDLRMVIRTKVDTIIRRNQCKPDIKEYLEHALYSKADRTFLWVTLVLHHLDMSLLASRKDIQHIIDEFPKTLSAVYERFLSSISREYQPLATKLLHFIVAASRPLMLSEIRVLIAVQSDHRNLADLEEEMQPNIQGTLEGVLGPLIRIWDGRVYLVHQSLKEYLHIKATPNKSKNPFLATYGTDKHEADLLLAESCISYLMLEDFNRDMFLHDKLGLADSSTSTVTESTETKSIESHWSGFELEDYLPFKGPAELDMDACVSIGERYALFDYAARYWSVHFASASMEGSNKLQKDVLQLLDAKGYRGSNWLRYYWCHNEPDLPYSPDFSPIVTASYFGYSALLKGLLDDCDVTNKTDEATRGLYWASRMGNCEALDLVLQEKVDPNTKFTDGETALTLATRFNRMQVVQRLLEDEGFVREQNDYRVNRAGRGGWTPLSIAASNGFSGIVYQLLQHSKIRPDASDSKEWTPLFWSVNGKQLDTLKMLISHDGVSLNHTDKSGRNILSWAAALGESEFVIYLLGLTNLRVQDADNDGRTALSWAAGSGHLDITILLRRSTCIDVSQVDKDSRNAISWACSGGHHKVVEYLIKHDPDGADRPDVNGWTPLAWALDNEAPKTMETLLRTGLVDPNKKDRIGRSVLSFAAGYGYRTAVQILLKVGGIDIESKDNDGRTPSSYAVRYPDIVNTLQDADR